ncbi:class I mannose-6-phosphate isomerase [Luteolibacter arcticus]|uniref:Class I mannose-6-phosphate isomerase n=1 Tax=Luteolibacter arcticus TaxID=1581411 RepID=A0ABT3GLR3_9BACT|nr:type I phosphomannose isomerase catalytic subunit [Luteolibacter arcticus]MCW1924401.1 class I mannose-6-phosphate isomerase [Luteolibacter arcticus]
MEPIVFEPLYMQRVWGGRELETQYGRILPDDAPYGESWEIVDRDKEQSVVRGGPYAGKSLHELWTGHRDEVFGGGLPDSDRFPLLIKVLDARDDLSIQVHPPAHLAAELGGEPKTEMWYIAGADAGAKLYVGLKNGATRGAFEQAIEDGTVAECVHAIEAKAGESIFIPSGRLHAIGAGFLIHEIQQNSDTTYRVFDWNRLGLDSKPRQLHVAESLASIDFEDFEPGMDEPDGTVIAECDYFRVEKLVLGAGESAGNRDAGRFSIFSVAEGEVTCGASRFSKGDFFLLPQGRGEIVAETEAVLLRTTLPS